MHNLKLWSVKMSGTVNKQKKTFQILQKKIFMPQWGGFSDDVRQHFTKLKGKQIDKEKFEKLSIIKKNLNLNKTKL